MIRFIYFAAKIQKIIESCMAFADYFLISVRLTKKIRTFAGA